MTASERSAEILGRLLKLHPQEIDLSLDRIERLLAVLGHPERRLPPVIHIAGTNGKGSTTAFMRAMLEASEQRVHVYTSPHLVRFHERIRLGRVGGGQLVGEDALVEVLTRVERLNAGAIITQFEITTAAAFVLFAENPADVTLLEVGLGGRVDATNVVAEPLAAVITSLSLDHERYLGGTVEQVAAEKAGIMKRGRPVVVAPQGEAALSVLEGLAARKGAQPFIANQDWTAISEHGRLIYQDEDGLLDLPPPRLAGRHQFANAGTAVATLRRAGLQLQTAAIEAGLLNVEWPARLQRLTSGKLVLHAGRGAEIWLDGGHNPGAGIVIAEAMADLEERVPRPLVVIAGMLSVKDPVGFLSPFAGLARQFIAVPLPPDHAGREPAELAEIARRLGLEASTAPSVRAALERIANTPRDDAPRILICGSLYLAGAVLEENGTIPS